MAAIERAAAGRRQLGRCYAAEAQQDADDHEPVAAMLQRRACKPQHPLVCRGCDFFERGIAVCTNFGDNNYSVRAPEPT